MHGVKHLALLIAVLFSFMGIAHAEDKLLSENDLNSFYLGVDAGKAKFTSDKTFVVVLADGMVQIDPSTSVGYSIRDTPLLNLGANNVYYARAYAGYQENENLAIELGYDHFQKRTEAIDPLVKTISGVIERTLSNSQLKLGAIDLMVKGMLPFDESFGVFAEGGAAYFKLTKQTDINYDFGTYNVALKETDVRHVITFVYGGGAFYQIDQFRFLGGWRKFRRYDELPDISVGYLGIQYHF